MALQSKINNGLLFIVLTVRSLSLNANISAKKKLFQTGIGGYKINEPRVDKEGTEINIDDVVWIIRPNY